MFFQSVILYIKTKAKQGCLQAKYYLCIWFFPISLSFPLPHFLFPFLKFKMDRSPLNQMPPPTSLFPIKRFLQLLLFLALLLGTFYIATSGHKRDVKEKQEVKTGVEFRVMTFNTWIHGRNVNNGLEKIAKHIKAVNPDVVVLQVKQLNDYTKKILL